MEVVCSFETLVAIYWTTWYYPSQKIAPLIVNAEGLGSNIIDGSLLNKA
jgi:hypothetical protein